MPRRIDMKKLLPYILGFAVSFLGASAATIVPSYLTPKYEQHPSSYIAPVTGSSSPVAAIVTHVIDTPYVVQGSCEKVKDLDGSGYSYRWMNNGQQFISATSCE